MNDIDKVAVGKRIKDIRLSLGLNMEEFGKRLGTSKGAVNNWEKGKNLPNTSRLSKISKLGNLDFEALLYGSLRESLISLMLYAENYPEIWSASWDDFKRDNKDKLEYGMLRAMYDYTSWKALMNTWTRVPKHIIEKGYSNLSDTEKKEVDKCRRKSKEENDARILKYALEYATRSNININDKLSLMNVLSLTVENLAQGYELSDIGFVKKAYDEIRNAYGEIDSFIYSYDRSSHERRRTDKVSIEVENEILPRISELMNYLSSLLNEITNEEVE